MENLDAKNPRDKNGKPPFHKAAQNGHVELSGLPKAEIFGRSRRFSLFGFRLRPPKFYSKCSAFGFVLKMSCS
jgi:hypothetical protein